MKKVNPNIIYLNLYRNQHCGCIIHINKSLYYKFYEGQSLVESKKCRKPQDHINMIFPSLPSKGNPKFSMYKKVHYKYEVYKLKYPNLYKY